MLHSVGSLPWEGVGLTQRDPEYSNTDFPHPVWCPAYCDQAHQLKGDSHGTRDMYEEWLVTLTQDHKPSPWSHWPFDASLSWQKGNFLGSPLPVPFLPKAQLADSKATMLQPRSTMVNQRNTLHNKRGHCGASGKKKPEKLRGFFFQWQKKAKSFHWWTTMLYFLSIIDFNNALPCWSYSFVEEIFCVVCCENWN